MGRLRQRRSGQGKGGGKEEIKVEKIEIKLKDCCLSCEDFNPAGVIGFSCCAIDGKREISCGHMKVCYKYMGLSANPKIVLESES